MKNLFPILILLVPFIGFSQAEGSITYVETMKFDIEIPEGMEELFKNVPTSNSSTKSLIFNKDQSLYTTIKKGDMGFEEEMEADGEHTFVRVEMDEPDNVIHNDLASKKIVEKRDFLGKTFLITGDMKSYEWKIIPERRQILDYKCMKATAELDSTTINAWFATEIPVSVGPQSYNGLPGAIMMLDINDGQTIIVASEVSFDPIQVDKFVKPTKGKKVTMKEFQKIQKEKMAEMNTTSGGAGVQIMIRG